MIYLNKRVNTNIRTARRGVKRTLSVLESMTDGDHVGDLDEMISDLRSALNSLDVLV